MNQDSRQQTTIVIVCLVVAVVLGYILPNFFGLDSISTVIVATIIMLVAAFIVLALSMGQRKSALDADAKATVQPILQRYARSHNAAQLITEFDAWAAEPHDHELLLSFAEATVDALIEGGHYKQAKRQLKVLERNTVTEKGKKKLDLYEKECAEKMAAKPAGKSKNHKK